MWNNLSLTRKIGIGYGFCGAILVLLLVECLRTPELTSSSLNVFVGLTGIGLFGVAAVGLATAQSVGRPAKMLVERIEALSGGYISGRVKLDRSDEFGRIATALNLFSDRMEALVFGLFEMIASGKLDLETPDQSDRDEIAPRLRQLMGSVKSLTTAIRTMQDAAQAGRIEYRADDSKFPGEYGEMIRGINGTLDAMLAPVDEAIEVLEKVAERNLTDRVTGDYQGGHERIKIAINRAIENLSDSLGHVAEGAEQVASASEQIGSGSQVLSGSASEQASTLEEIASSLQEISGMATSNASNAKSARDLVSEAHTASAQGVQNMNELNSAMEKISASSDQTARIVKTIDEIAFQTNLLALNAAVEAARAGESGKGFAVVAEEVRNLAMRSAEAAKNTAELIEQAVQNSAAGVTLNATVLAQLQEINRKVESANLAIEEVASASDQQREGVNQVNEAIEQMNQMTQATAANAEESASAAEELSSQALSMQHLVSEFRLARKTNPSARSGLGGSPSATQPAGESGKGSSWNQDASSNWVMKSQRGNPRQPKSAVHLEF